MSEKQAEAPDYRGMIRIFSKNLLAGPILETRDAQTVVMYDETGIPCVILSRLKDNTWAFCNCSDSDWEQMKQRFGVH